MLIHIKAMRLGIAQSRPRLPIPAPTEIAMIPPSLDSHVGDLAAGVPGAAGLFRRAGINFCCGAGRTLAEAAETKGLDAAQLLAGLEALRRDAAAEAPEATEALIDHILTRCHAVHRAELDALIPLAGKVETMHAGHAAAPGALVDLLLAMREEMEAHMLKEEQVLFPMMRGGGHPMILHPIARMRDEHDGHADRLRALEHLTRGFVPPADACGSWRTLYAGLEKFAADLVRHMHLENAVLFPRFESAAN